MWRQLKWIWARPSKISPNCAGTLNGFTHVDWKTELIFGASFDFECSWIFKLGSDRNKNTWPCLRVQYFQERSCIKWTMLNKHRIEVHPILLFLSWWVRPLYLPVSCHLSLLSLTFQKTCRIFISTRFSLSLRSLYTTKNEWKLIECKF